MAYIGQEPGQGQAQRSIFTAVAVTDTVTADDNSLPLNYTVGQVSVYLNGVKQVVGDDVVASNGSTLVFASDYAIGDVIEVIALSTFSPADTVPATGGTFTGQVTVASPVINTGVSGTAILDEDAMGSDSATKLATQQSIKAYVDAKPSTLAGLTDATVSSSDPVVASNPSAVGHYWINSTSGEAYICTDATTGSNVWTNIGPGTGDIVPPFDMDYLVIAGGGGCASYYAGGGAGGYRTNFGTEMSGGGNSNGEDDFSVTPGVAISIVVGAGGGGANGTKNNGSNSIFSSITSIGGGAGGFAANSTDSRGNAGGSGGGTLGSDYTQLVGLGTDDQGFDGGQGAAGIVAFTSGGAGGGAGDEGGGADGDFTTPIGFDGGPGLNSLITGGSVGRGGGGAAFCNSPVDGGTASHGGGANGNGLANTGGGGGAYSSQYGSGGDGVVILRIPAANSAAFTNGISEADATADTSVSGFKIYTITATSSTSETVTFS